MITGDTLKNYHGTRLVEADTISEARKKEGEKILKGSVIDSST